MTSPINSSLLKLVKRAEMNDRSKLVATFVDVGPLFTLLSNRDHQVMYGRRGTGKTHAFSFLAEKVKEEGDAAVYLDMRTIGSTGGLYADSSKPLSQRATQLLVDTMTAVHDGLYEFFIEQAEELDLSTTGVLLDQLAEAITSVEVKGDVEHETKTSESVDNSNLFKAGLSANAKGITLGVNVSEEEKQKTQYEVKMTEKGVPTHRVHFGAVGQVLRRIAEAMKGRRVWLLLDEWSNVPIDLQPYLADLLRHTVFPATFFSVKIAAIEQRSMFRISSGSGGYIGIELGADVSADLNLDDYMVFDNDADRAKLFFQELLFKHIKEVEGSDVHNGLHSSQDMVQQGFTQRTAFDEFVRATEGVPRDAINIATTAAQRALDDPISVNHIRVAARNWYQRDKEGAVKANPEAQNLLHWIIDEVIGKRRARAFLLRSNVTHDLIDTLFDARVLHLLKRNVSARDQPGVRYDVYKLDYGCYVDLINTTGAPQGLLPAENDSSDSFLDVPPDDYRAIRRAILDLDEFTKRPPTLDLF